MDDLKTRIRHVPDFPKAGILFYDITTLLQDREGFRLAIDSLSLPVQGSGHRRRRRHREPRLHLRRGRRPIGSAPGFTPVRKPGKLPSTTVRATYDLEYGTDTLEIHNDGVGKGQRVLIVDDLLATGGTATATTDLVKKARWEGASRSRS
jgi:adenine phosphoribosyltransferase